MSLGAQATRRERPLPAPVWSCPMHPDVIETKAGQCPQCKMALEPVRLDSVFSCPLHRVIERDRAGQCPICKRELVSLTMALTFTCEGDPKVNEMEPGTCRDGRPRVPKHTARAHGDHNAKHGGMFFMAPDNWHHLEGTLIKPGLFRVYLYDDYTRQLSRDKLKEIAGRVVLSETYDGATRTARENVAVPLRMVAAGSYLEAKVDAVTLPASMTAKLTVKKGGPEYRFDFMFADFAAAPATPATTGAAPAAERAPAPARTAKPAAAAPKATTPAPAAPAPPSAAGVPDMKPGTRGSTAPMMAMMAADTRATGELLTELGEVETQVRGLIEAGALTEVWAPAFRAKDLALTLEERSGSQVPDAVRAAVRTIVLAAWQLDNFGDLGDRAQATAAQSRLSAAVRDLLAALKGR